jgi:hypothetical protein
MRRGPHPDDYPDLCVAPSSDDIAANRQPWVADGQEA